MARLGQLVEIIWEDSTSIADWHDEEETRNMAKGGSWIVHNAGWVAYEDDDCIVIAGRKAPNARQHGLLERIPNHAIREIRSLRKG